MPPRIEKWVMEMQQVDYELVYKPGKDEADPLHYLSRHLLPEMGNDNTENIIRWTMNTEHAIVIMQIREETLRDEVMQQLQSWTKLVKKIVNFAHISQSNSRNTPPEESQTFTPPFHLTFFQPHTNIDEGKGGCVVDVSL